MTSLQKYDMTGGKITLEIGIFLPLIICLCDLIILNILAKDGSVMFSDFASIVTIFVLLVGVVISIVATTKNTNSKIRSTKDKILHEDGDSLENTKSFLSDEHSELLYKRKEMQKDLSYQVSLFEKNMFSIYEKETVRREESKRIFLPNSLRAKQNSQG